MLLKDLIELIEGHYPKRLAYEWDNPGLILGNTSRDIKKAVVTLDVTNQVLEEAIEAGADCIIAHHPVIFSGLKKITDETLQGELILKAAENKIAIFAAHTNMDVSPGGINKRLADLFSLKDCIIIEPNKDFPDAGLGQLGYIEKTTLKEFLPKVKEILKTPFLRYSGNEKQIIQRVAIGSGSCGELIPDAIRLGADVIITGDLKYHTCLDSANDNFSIIDAGHFPTEQMVRDMFYELLKDTDVTLIKSSQQDVFKVF